MNDKRAVRGKRGRLVHWTRDLRICLCGRRCDGFIVEPDVEADCQACRDAAEFN